MKNWFRLDPCRTTLLERFDRFLDRHGPEVLIFFWLLMFWAMWFVTSDMG